MSKSILLTGGAGYVGSHAYIALVEAGYNPIIFDNFGNSHSSVLDRLAKITNTIPEFINGSIADRDRLEKIFKKYEPCAVMHFAGLKAVSESVKKPLDYYNNNVTGTLNLLAAMQAAHVKTLVFSSSAAVYGSPTAAHLREDAPCTPTCPYGRTKLMIETILKDLSQAEPDWRIACLRYFNPGGAHVSGLIGDDPEGIPTNLIPDISRVAQGLQEYLPVFGNDYPTLDGTGVRDYIHVMDLVEGHIAALNYLHDHEGILTLNLGTGHGVSVLQMVHAFEKASGKKIPYQIEPRRPGDVAECWADPALAYEKLGWKTHRTLNEICEDHWRWASKL